MWAHTVSYVSHLWFEQIRVSWVLTLTRQGATTFVIFMRPCNSRI